MNPIPGLIDERAAARAAGDANADICFLAVASPDGDASVRTLVLRDIVGDRFGLFISGTSHKWSLLTAGASYQMLVYWPSLMLQYRISGTIETMDRAYIANQWQNKPDASKYLDYLYEIAPQSSPVASRPALLDLVSKLKSEHPAATLQPPQAVSGVWCIATTIERLDLSSSDRIHDRTRHTVGGIGPEGDKWQTEVLSP
jgi:pyridoxamine 5'-phosphate oxidase